MHRVSLTLTEGVATEMLTLKASDDYGVVITALNGEQVNVPWELFPAFMATLEAMGRE